MADVYWLDGFELYDNLTDLQKVYTNTGGEVTINVGTARTGDRRLSCRHELEGIWKVIPGLTNTTIAIGFGARCNSFPTQRWDDGGIQLLSQNGNLQLTFSSSVTGFLNCYRGNTLLGVSTEQCFELTAWNYIEIRVYLHDSAGTVEAWLNGKKVMNLTSKDTKQHGDAYVAGFGLNGSYNGRYYYYDDLYFASDILGICKIDPIRVTGAGNSAQFAPSAGANYENVDESPGPDYDTTYNDGDAVDEIDLFEMGDLAGDGLIHAVKSQIVAEATDAGTAEITPVLRINSNDYLGDASILTTSYKGKHHVWNVNPDDAAVFELADINALELGYKVTDLV